MTYPVIISQYCHPCYTFRLLYLKTRTCYKQFSFYIYFLTSILILYHAKNHFHVGWKIFFYLSFLIIESRGLNMRIFTPVKNWNLFSKLTDHREKRIFRSTVFMNAWKNAGNNSCDGWSCTNKDSNLNFKFWRMHRKAYF